MKSSIPSLNWLKVFEVAARVESFARAAQLLDLSTSAVSQQIKALEAHLGEQLFIRGARHVELTDTGHAYLVAVRQALQLVQETTESLFGDNKENSLRLQVNQLFATTWLATRLPRFSELHPRVQLHLTGSYGDQDYQLTSAELKILFGPVHRSWAQCDRLFDETIYPVARADVAQSIQSPSDFLKQRLIQISTHRINWNQVLRASGIDSIPANRFSFTDNTSISMALAASGYGVALARAPTTDALVRQLGLQPCRVGARVKSSEAYYLVYQNVESLSPAATVFREWLLDTVEQHESS